MAEAMLPEEIAAGRGAARRARREGSPRLTLDARTQIVHAFRDQDPEAKLGLLQLQGADAAVLLRAPRRGRPEPELGGHRLSGPELAAAVRRGGARRRSRSRRSPATSATLDGRRLRGRLRRRRRRDRRRVREGGQVACSCSRWAATATSPTSSSSSCPATSSSTTAAAWRPPSRARSRSSPAQTLGGGTVVNYMNCVRTPDSILARVGRPRARGARRPRVRHRAHGRRARAHRREHRGHEAERHAPAADRRPATRSATSTARSGATRRSTTTREFCGYCPMGCQQGCKRSAMKTWLQDCSDAGGRCVPGCHADRILTEDGRATGVEATVTHARRLDHGAHRRGADRGGGLRLDRVAGAAAAQRHRRAGGRQAPPRSTPPSS